MSEKRKRLISADMDQETLSRRFMQRMTGEDIDITLTKKEYKKMKGLEKKTRKLRREIENE